MHLPKADSQREKWDVTAGLGCCSPIGSSLQLSFVFLCFACDGQTALACTQNRLDRAKHVPQVCQVLRAFRLAESHVSAFGDLLVEVFQSILS